MDPLSRANAGGHVLNLRVVGDYPQVCAVVENALQVTGGIFGLEIPWPSAATTDENCVGSG